MSPARDPQANRPADASHRICSKCAAEKPRGDFREHPSRKALQSGWCHACRIEYGKAYYAANRERLRAYNRQRYRDDPSHRARAKLNFQKYKEKSLAAMQETQRQRIARVRDECLSAYGSACACCGETMRQFLTIDHINGRGVEDEKHRELKGFRLVDNLRSRGWPRDNYQLLCFNCNCAKGLYGVCPHIDPTLTPLKRRKNYGSKADQA
jgi:hypothetical protein